MRICNTAESVRRFKTLLMDVWSVVRVTDIHSICATQTRRESHCENWGVVYFFDGSRHSWLFNCAD
jgi:hypothetical protein